MDQATQQNAALVEQSAAAAGSLKAQAAQLVDAVAVFRIGTQPQAIAAPRSVPQLPRAVAPAPKPQATPPKPVLRKSPPPAAKPAALAKPVAVAAQDDDWESF
jgi:hypothetical protein